ncbi:hypothetical protein JCM10212_004992 [Sporobolomyces blumeae]
MAASSERRGRKIKREGGHRTPACRPCQQRKVKCSGGSPCSACCRKAAWDGIPPPDHCEYDGGYVPERKTSSPSTSGAAGSDGSPARYDDDAADGKGKGKSSKPLQKGLACLACKARRVRCDGSKPACSSCLRTAKRERREACCVYRADLHIAQQQLKMQQDVVGLDARTNTKLEAGPPDDEPKPQASPSQNGFAPLASTSTPRIPLPSIDLSTIPASALPPLPAFAAPPPPQTVFPSFPTTASRSSSSSTVSLSHSHSHPPSPSLTHASTDPSSSYPSPMTPFSSVEELLPPSSSLYNYPPLPYPPAESELWSVPPLSLDAAVARAPAPPPAVASSLAFPACASVEFKTAKHDLDLTLTLPMSPLPSFSSDPMSGTSGAPIGFVHTPVKVEPTEGWWEEQVRDQLLLSTQ